jgi:arginine/lysine/ornithine decarboxylase
MKSTATANFGKSGKTGKSPVKVKTNRFRTLLGVPESDKDRDVKKEKKKKNSEGETVLERVRRREEHRRREETLRRQRQQEEGRLDDESAKREQRRTEVCQLVRTLVREERVREMSARALVERVVESSEGRGRVNAEEAMAAVETLYEVKHGIAVTSREREVVNSK